MRRQAMKTVRGLAVSMMLTSGAIASAPPAPPVFIDELATRIVPTPTAASFDAYCATSANDLTVTVDCKRIAGNKAVWIAAEHHRLGKVDRFVVGFAEGYDVLLVIKRYDDRSDLPVSPSVLFDPRYKARAVRYAVGPDHLIHTIQIVETDGVFQVPK